MTTFRSILWLVTWMAFGVKAGMCAEENQPRYDSLVIPLNKSPEFATVLLRQVEKVMAPVSFAKQKRAAVSSFVTPEGCYVLHGDIFGSGQRFVIMELQADHSVETPATDDKVVGLAWQNAGRWELCTLLDIDPVWRPKGWKESDNDYLPITPAEQPFELQDLFGDGVPEVILVADVHKYWQQHFVFRWDAKAKALTCVADSMGKPVRSGNYLILHYNSGHRSIWGEWAFCQWEGDRLIEKVLWHDETPYNNPEEPFMLAKRVNSDGTKLELKVNDGEWVSDTESVYQVTRQEKPFASVTFKWARTLEAVTADGYYPSGEESAYLFEKLTGLPRKLYPGLEDQKRIKSLEKSVKIIIEGEPAAVQMLSPR